MSCLSVQNNVLQYEKKNDRHKQNSYFMVRFITYQIKCYKIMNNQRTCIYRQDFKKSIIHIHPTKTLHSTCLIRKINKSYATWSFNSRVCEALPSEHFMSELLKRRNQDQLLAIQLTVPKGAYKFQLVSSYCHWMLF